MSWPVGLVMRSAKRSVGTAACSTGVASSTAKPSRGMAATTLIALGGRQVRHPRVDGLARPGAHPCGGPRGAPTVGQVAGLLLVVADRVAGEDPRRVCRGRR